MTRKEEQEYKKAYCQAIEDTCEWLSQQQEEFVDRQTLNIKNRLKEVYGEVLPEELDKQIGYIVSEIYNATRNHCAQVWNVPPKEGW